MEYRIEFTTSGGSEVDEQWIPSGGSASVPDDPVRDGFRFGGWYTQDGNMYDFSLAVGSDMTLKAVWISDGSADDGNDPNIERFPVMLIIAVMMLAIVGAAVILTRL